MNSKLKLTAALALGGVAACAVRSWGRNKPGSQERERIGYPPLDTLKEVGENIWIVDSGPIKAAGLSIPIRMTVVRLSGGSLWLHSPTQLTDALASELRKIGPVRHLVAPTIAHWTFLPDWQKGFPEAELWTVPGLRERPQVRASGLRIDHELGNEAPAVWAGEIDQGLVQGGGGFKEIYFHHRPSRTLVLADLIQNLEPDRLPPVTAAIAELSRATTGRTAAHVRLAMALGGTEAKEQIAHLLKIAPDRVIFAHGSWFDTDAAARLRRAFDWFH